ncbi:hypothetical protein ABTZ78_17095 [Streptomyces bauhiniae]|uniref:hypothetical protein n=1 Tax=Streptomyces bauhiniae TaxID=2340725 RepID=UPI003332F75D
MTFTESTTVVTRREWAVPVDPARGASHSAINAAWTAAARSYRADHQAPADAPVPASAIGLWPGDSEVVVSYETQVTPAGISVDALARYLAAYDQGTGRSPVPYERLAPAEAQLYLESATKILQGQQ